MSRFVHHKKCKGGHAFEEVDHNVYCLGRTDAYFEDEVFLPECKKCPRLLKNNEEKLAEYCESKWQKGTMNERMCKLWFSE